MHFAWRVPPKRQLRRAALPGSLESPMAAIDYRQDATGLLLVDPYNDFLSEGGLLWPRLKEIAEELGLLDNLRAILAAARAGGIRVFIVPHRQWEKGDYESWRHVNPTQRNIMKHHS